jgi:hypothetical protein
MCGHIYLERLSNIYRWHAEFQSMTAVGIHAIIVPHTATGTGDGDVVCPGGRFANFGRWW